MGANWTYSNGTKFDQINTCWWRIKLFIGVPSIGHGVPSWCEGRRIEVTSKPLFDLPVTVKTRWNQPSFLGKRGLRNVQSCLKPHANHSMVLQATSLGQTTRAEIMTQACDRILLSNALVYTLHRCILWKGDYYFSVQLLTTPFLEIAAWHRSCYFLELTRTGWIEIPPPYLIDHI